MSRGAVMWFTGLPSSGKTTLALAVQRALGARCVLLDSDAVRGAVFPWLGYGSAGRGRFYRSLAALAALLARQELVVLVAATANLRAYRAHARRLAPRFLEVFVDTPLEVCQRRDAKGLYRTGGPLPGRGAPYEAPLQPEVRTGEGEMAEAVRACLAALNGHRTRAHLPPSRAQAAGAATASRSRPRTTR